MNPLPPRTLTLIDGLDLASAPPLDPDDPALTLGLSAFETLRTYGQRPCLLAHHHHRLGLSAARLRIPPPPSLGALRDELERLLSPPGEAGEWAVRITLTGGGRRIVRARPAPPPFPLLRCALAPWAPLRGLAAVKHGSRAPWVVQVRDYDVDDVIGVDLPAGMVVEATTGAVLARVAGRWVSPSDDGQLLPSVTLSVLEAVAAQQGDPIVRRPLLATEIRAAEELYLCSALKILGAVVVLDGEPAGGRGPAGQRLAEQFLERLALLPAV